MKKITLLLLLFSGVFTAQNSVTLDASKTWKSYVAAFNVADNSYAFGFEYDFSKNKATFNSNELTLQPNFAIWAENASSWNAGWFSAANTPNKNVEVSGFVEDSSLAGSDLTFSGNVDAVSINSGYKVEAFIKALDPSNNYATVTNKRVEITSADVNSGFTVTASASELPAGHIIQYGFSVTGLIADPAEEGNLGSVVVSNPATSNPTPTYDLLESFNGTGLEGTFGGAAAAYDADPDGGSDQVIKITNSGAEVWQGINVVLQNSYQLTAATQLTMQLDVYSTTPITIAPKAQGGVSGAPDSVTSVDHTGTGWETLILTFDKSLDGKVPANGIYSDFALHVNWDTTNNTFGAPDGRVFYIKNLKGLLTAPPADPAPTDAPPTPPTRNASDVISLFSDAYTNVTIDEWGTSWDSADISDVTIAQNNIKKVNIGNFLGVSFTSNRLDLTNFTHFHIDIWTETATLDKSLNHKLSNHANVEAGETNAIEFSTTNASNPSLPNPNPGTWISYDIPLSDFTIAGGGKLDRESIGQYIISSNLGLVYFDNIYFYKASTASVDNNALLGFSMYPNPANNILNISAKETIEKAEIYNVLGKRVMSVNINKTSESISISSLASGVYLVKYNVNDKVGTAKFIKQ
ncbi:MAG: T9SS type A sorting domain-containing protein [Flavobacteriaceae bacterium]|nr:T9SS type A sorting domain-containing protein [Flavobacteriaceae bacterium]